MRVEVNSGFQRGGSLWKWCQETGSFSRLARAGENTWHDDGDSSFVREVPDDFRGAVLRFWGAAAFTYCHRVELIGFSEAELNSPAPVRGWAFRSSGVRSNDCDRVETFGQWAEAVVGGDFTPDSAMLQGGRTPPRVHPVSGTVLVRLPYEAGDQAADGWAIYSISGEYIRCKFGTGDSTPEPIEGKVDWEFDSQFDRDCRARAEESRLWDEATARATSPEWADVAAHLRSSYRVGQNPLPTLRRRHAGTWRFFDAGRAQCPSPGDGDVLFLGPNNVASVPAWYVLHVPSK